MINFYNQVPSVYPSASRDFQYLSWLINIVLNSIKHNVDDLYDLPNLNADPKVSELLALTLGFKIKRNYDQKQLAALVAILPSILKYKGTLKAVKMAAEALITASGSMGDTDCEAHGAQLSVILPKTLVDITLFLDLLDYILPAGMTCRIIRKNQTKRVVDNIVVKNSDTVHYEIHEDLDLENLNTGLSGLFDLNQSTPEFTSNFKKSDGTLNAGLLDNTVIPALQNAVITPADPAYDVVALYSTEEDGSHKLLRAEGECGA